MREVAIFGIFISLSCIAEQSGKQKATVVLVAPSAALHVERTDEGYSFSEGCQRLEYTVMTPYPGTPVLDRVFAGLRGQGWTRVERLKRRFLPSPGVTKSLGRWEQWKNVAGGRTYVRAEQWRNKNGDLVSYVFWYATPALTALEAVGAFCPAPVVNKYACHHPAAKPKDPPQYSLLVQITDVQAIGKDYKVTAQLQNDGRQPVLVGINGALTDGKPNLWVLGVEQEEKQGDWKSVDAICAESPAPDFLDLQPGASIESWVMAVELPVTNHRIGVCRREIAHLHGRIRVSIRYYTDPCEFSAGRY